MNKLQEAFDFSFWIRDAFDKGDFDTATSLVKANPQARSVATLPA